MQLPAWANTALTTVQKKSPTLLIVGGIAGTITATIMACRSTMELSDVLEEHKKTMNQIHKIAEDDTGYRENIMKHDITATYFNTAKKVAGLYWASAAVGAASIGAIIASNCILANRNAALVASCTAVTSAFQDYRKRVVDELGSEADYRFKTGMTEVETGETVTLKNGKEKIVKKKEMVCDPTAKGTGYLKYITEANPYWNPDPLQMQAWFNMEQSYLNNRFHINRRLTVAEVYERLGLVEDNITPDTLVMGWLRDVGDQCVDLNVQKVSIPDANGKFIPAYAVDLNVQCNVYTEMKKRKMKALNIGKEAA